MAKGKGNGPRDVQNIANRRLLALNVPQIQTPRIRLTPDLRLVEDRRTWHPDGPTYRPVRAINSQRPRLKPVAFSSPKLKNLIPTALGFEVPKKVAICVRRKQRKEVLFAKQKTGRGSARPKRNQWSDIKC